MMHHTRPRKPYISHDGCGVEHLQRVHTMDCESCGNEAKGTVAVKHHVCSGACAQRIGDETRQVYTATPGRPLPPGLYVQGDRPNTWFRAKGWQRDAYDKGRDNLGHILAPSDMKEAPYHLNGTDYIITQSSDGQTTFLTNKSTGTRRMYYEQPEQVVPPPHRGLQ